MFGHQKISQPYTIPKIQTKPAAELMDVTICVPTYNRARHLKYLLNWFAEQGERLGGAHILVSDNQSTDETRATVESFESKLPRLRYRLNTGKTTAERNVINAYHAAETEFCVYCADDDFLDIDNLKKIVAKMRTSPDIGAVFSPHRFFDARQGNITGQFYSVPGEIRVERGNFSGLGNLLLDFGIFPEIAVFRTKAAKTLIHSNHYGYYAFVDAGRILAGSAILFQSTHPHYLWVTSHPVDEPRTNAGTTEAMEHWDRHRAGLEYIVSLAASHQQIDAGSKKIFDAKIDAFVSGRLTVALRLHVGAGNIMNALVLARRLHAKDMFPEADLELLRLGAAAEYIATEAGRKHRLAAGFPPRMAELLKNSQLLAIDDGSLDEISLEAAQELAKVL